MVAKKGTFFLMDKLEQCKIKKTFNTLLKRKSGYKYFFEKYGQDG